MSEKTTLEDRVNELESIVQNQQEHISNLEDKINILESRADHIVDGLNQDEERIDSLETFRDDIIESQLAQRDVAMEASLTVAERILCFGWNGVEINKDEHKNKRRAIIIIKDWDNYSTGTANGTRIQIVEIKKILANELNKNIQYGQAKRVAKSIEEITDNKITIKNEEKDKKTSVYKDNETTIIDEVSQLEKDSTDE